MGEEKKKGFWQKLKEQSQIDSEEMIRKLEEQNKELKQLVNAGRTKSITLEYLGGHPGITGKKISIKQTIDQNILNFNSVKLKITKIEWDEKGKRSMGKAAAGAIIGGALTGGIGLIAGAAIGGRKKDDSLAILTAVDNSVEYTLYFRCDQKEYKKLASML